jgi:hypothetical protein
MNDIVNKATINERREKEREREREETTPSDRVVLTKSNRMLAKHRLAVSTTKSYLLALLHFELIMFSFHKTGVSLVLVAATVA